MRLYNYLFLLIFIFYFSFLLFRVIGERSPVNALWLTGFLVSIFIFIKAVKFCVNFFKNQQLSAKETSVFVRIGVEIAFFISKIHWKIEIDFLQIFLNEKPFISWIFFLFMKIFEKLVFKISFSLFIVIILPWLFSLFVFFLEITLFSGSFNFFFFTLYCFSLKFLIYRLLLVFLLIAEMKFNNFSEHVVKRNLFLFPKELKSFFLVNFIIKNHLLFNEPSLKNKKMIVFLWNLFSELQYLRSSRLSIFFFRHHAECLNKFCYNVNILLFSIAFFYLSSDSIFFPNILKGIMYSDIFCCGITFFTMFLIFCFFLDYLYKNINHGEKHQFDNFSDCFNNLAQFFFHQKIRLLKEYPFLKKEDLLDFDKFSDNLSATDHNTAFFSDYTESFFTKKELEDFKLVLLGIIQWFEFNVKAEKINLETLSFKP